MKEVIVNLNVISIIYCDALFEAGSRHVLQNNFYCNFNVPFTARFLT